VRFGRTVERGFLPVYAVDTEEQARTLLVSVCPRNLAGDFIARELADKQTLENLSAFGERLHARAIELGITKANP
jgi:hypothetical protein